MKNRRRDSYMPESDKSACPCRTARHRHPRPSEREHTLQRPHDHFLRRRAQAEAAVADGVKLGQSPGRTVTDILRELPSALGSLDTSPVLAPGAPAGDVVVPPLPLPIDDWQQEK